MKQRAHIVLGSGYGDEGKGLTTDFLCSKLTNPIVIRFSGGQQAGHTVIKDGIKHIHSNFGAGTLREVPTYFTEHTTFYPVTIQREADVLMDKGIINIELILHPLAKLTTPYDVYANRTCSTNLSDGTCGLGIGKTMKRNEESPFKLYAIDLLHTETLKLKLESIKNNYYKELEDSEELKKEVEAFYSAVEKINWRVKGYDFLKNFDNLIFEGSQGILLDMHHGVFPNVTFSNTTSKNAHEVLDKLGVKDKNRSTFYATRTYHTRHGSGFFKEEEINLVNNEEEINVLNKFQKEFKVAPMNYDLLNHALRIDSIYSKGKINLVATCNDQYEKLDYSKIDFSFDKIIESYSPESKDFKTFFSKKEEKACTTRN